MGEGKDIYKARREAEQKCEFAQRELRRLEREIDERMTALKISGLLERLVVAVEGIEMNTRPKP